MTLSAGLRYDSTEVSGKDLIDGGSFETADDDDDFWSPKAGIVWRFRSDASAYFSYARGFRLPNVDEAFGFFGFNEGLEPERSDSYEFGVKLRREQIHFDLTFYRLDVKDEILFNHEIDGVHSDYSPTRARSTSTGCATRASRSRPASSPGSGSRSTAATPTRTTRSAETISAWELPR